MRAAALLCLLLACGNKESPPASQSTGSAIVGSASSASGGSDDPWAKPAAPPPAPPPVPCNDDELEKHIEDSLEVSMAYLAALEKKTAKWGKDCEQAKKDLVALEPDATKFMASMKDFVAWAQTLAPNCAARVQELGDKMTVASEIEKRTPALETKVKPILEKCQNHPGFTEAAAKGLRVMHRKRVPAP